MPTATAMKLCPQLVLVKGNYHKYSEASEQVHAIFHQYTDHVEGLSLDEAYLDVTDCGLFQNSATWIAEDIRKKIFEKTGLTASAGIAPNKLIAKMASDYNKPNGQFTIAPSMVNDFMKTVPVERINGVGRVTAKYLHDLGIKTCLEMQRYTRSDLVHLLGKFGNSLYDYCRGHDEREVITEYERKSLSNESTFDRDLTHFEEMKASLVSMVADLQDSLKNHQDREVKNLHVKIKYHDFRQTTIERQLPLEEENFLLLLEERWSQDPRPVRLLGVGVKFYDEFCEDDGELQLDLLTDDSA
jgi:DNA polymerase-4